MRCGYECDASTRQLRSGFRNKIIIKPIIDEEHCSDLLTYDLHSDYLLSCLGVPVLKVEVASKKYTCN